jgi:hypothetical protein
MSNPEHEVLIVADTDMAIGGPLRTLIGSHDPMAAIQDALNAQECRSSSLPGQDGWLAGRDWT